jgi:hypothetical protein
VLHGGVDFLDGLHRQMALEKLFELATGLVIELAQEAKSTQLRTP